MYPVSGHCWYIELVIYIYLNLVVGLVVSIWIQSIISTWIYCLLHGFGWFYLLHRWCRYWLHIVAQLDGTGASDSSNFVTGRCSGHGSGVTHGSLGLQPVVWKFGKILYPKNWVNEQFQSNIHIPRRFIGYREAIQKWPDRWSCSFLSARPPVCHLWGKSTNKITRHSRSQGIADPRATNRKLLDQENRSENWSPENPQSFSELLHLSLPGFNGLRHVVRHGLVLLKLHAVVGPALRQVAQLGNVAEHLRQGHAGVHHLNRTQCSSSACLVTQVTKSWFPKHPQEVRSRSPLQTGSRDAKSAVKQLNFA